MQNPDGGWSMWKRDPFEGSDPDSTAQILFLFRDMFGEEDATYQKGIEFFEKSLDKVAQEAEQGYYVAPNGERRNLDIYHLSHLLLSSLVDTNRRIDAGYDMKDLRVKQIVQAVLNTQHEDGGWNPFWTKKSDPTYTVLTIKLLMYLNFLNKQKFRTISLEWIRNNLRA